MKRKSIIQELSILAALILFAPISGCVTTRMYTGQTLPREQTAVIRGSLSQRLDFSHKAVGVKIIRVDGKQAKKPVMAGTFQRVEVLPGHHKMVVEIYWAEAVIYYGLFGAVPGEYSEGVLDYQELELNVAAEHEYKVVAKKWWRPDAFIVVLDADSGEEVFRYPMRRTF